MLLSLSVMAILDEESDRKIVVGLRFRAKANRTLWNTNKYITVVYHVAEHISKKQFTWSELWQKFLQLLLQFSGDFIPFSCGFFFFHLFLPLLYCAFCLLHHAPGLFIKARYWEIVLTILSLPTSLTQRNWATLLLQWMSITWLLFMGFFHELRKIDS